MMWVSVDLCLIPLGAGISLSPYVAACEKIIKKSQLNYELGPNSTAVEGEWNAVFLCIKECHQVIHQQGVERIYTTVKINTRTDKRQSFREKVPSVNRLLEES